MLMLVIFKNLKFSDYLHTISKSGIFAIGIIFTLLMGLLDYITGVELSLAIFYLIPILFVGWYGNKYQVLFISLLSTLLWLQADMVSIERYSNHVIPFWNALVRLGFFIMVVLLVYELKKLKTDLEEKVNERTKNLTIEINERKRIECELRKKGEKLSQLAKRTQSLKEADNSRIAREIHDELGQAMTAIKIDIFWLSKKYSNDRAIVDSLMTITNTVDEAIQSLQNISTRLRPRLLDTLGLLPAMEYQLKEFQSRTGIKTSIYSSSENFNLRHSVSNAIFKIFQESLTNIARHSKASNVSISIDTNSNENIVVKIKDDGIGLPPNYLDKSNSLGILGMKERAGLVGGKVNLCCENKHGTTVIAEIPINKHIHTEV
jgi:signal transduction histidine kinase